MTIRNEAQLKKAMMARLEKAMEITRKEIEAKMYEDIAEPVRLAIRQTQRLFPRAFPPFILLLI